ncbi:MAG: hypothetical protein JXM69_18215 [Anaerolineae bacterium]|nr:hypothetical protein [Anaerolineae bacterium]
MIRSFTRKVAFELVRRDLAIFLREHEAELLQIFREELQRLDDEIPEENVFVDLRMVPLGEAVLKACLRAFDRFLTSDFPIQETDTLEENTSADEDE